MLVLGAFLFLLGVLFLAAPAFHPWTDESYMLMPYVLPVLGFLFLFTGLGILMFKAWQPRGRG